MSSKRKRYLFNFVGIGIVALWLLIKKYQFNYHGESIEITIDNAMIAKTSQNGWIFIIASFLVVFVIIILAVLKPMKTGLKALQNYE